MLRNGLITLLLTLALSSAAGCGMEVQDYTRLVRRGLPVAQPAAATLVIMRRGGIGEMLQVMDERGALLAQVGLNSWVRIPLAPGHHRIYAMMGTETVLSSVIDLEAAPGRIYYASTPRMGVLWAVAPRHTDRWEARHVWIVDGAEVEIDPAMLAQLESEVPMERRLAAIQACDDGWNRLDDAHRADYVLAASDGVSAH